MNINSTRAAGLAAVLAICPLTGRALEIEPSITLGEIYTSNVNLQPSGQEEEDWVTRVAPRLLIGFDGNRLDLDLDYTFEALFYAEDSDRNEAYNQLSLAGLFNLINEDLQLRGQASLAQVNIAPEEPVSNSNINTTGNRTDALIWNIGPEWRHEVFGNSETDGHLWVGRVNYEPQQAEDAELVQDVQTMNGRFSLHSSVVAPGSMTYDAVYEYDRLEYDISGDTVVQATWLQLGYQVNSEFQVFGLAGLDSNFEDLDDHSLSEPRWEAGVASSFGAETMRASVGHRFFGATYSFNWDHKADNATYSASYSENPSTSDLNALREIPVVPPGTEGELPPPSDSDISRPGSPSRYITKRADLVGSWELYRSTLVVSAFWEDRLDQTIQSTTTPGETASLNDENSYGADVEFSWELGSKSDVTVGAGWRHREYSDLTNCDTSDPDSCSTAPINRDELYTLRAGLAYDLGLRTSLTGETGFQSRQGTSDGVSDYDEFWASVQLVRTF